MTEPDVLPLRSVMVPVPLVGGEVNVRVTLVSIPTLVAPLAGLIELNSNPIVVKEYVLINAFIEVVVRPLKAPASTTTKVVVALPMFDGGSIVTAPPEIVTLEEETPMVENAVPPALPDLNVILPVFLYTCWSKVIMILEFILTPVAPILGLNVIGTGGTSSLVKVAIPALMLPVVFTFPLVPIPTPVSPLPLPTNEVAVITPATIPEELNVRPVPTLIRLFVPSKVIDALPTVRIPVTLAFPSTRRAVVPIPMVTVPDAFLIVVIPVTLIPEELIVTAEPTITDDAVATPVSDKLLPKIVPV